MNNEIKEILDFKEDADYKRLSVDEITILRDYITNLQEENKKLQFAVKDTKENADEIICELKEENKELNDDNIWWNNRFKAVQRNYKDYKSRNEKAIELINKALNINSDYVEYEFGTELLRQELLEILQGSDKE